MPRLLALLIAVLAASRVFAASAVDEDCLGLGLEHTSEVIKDTAGRIVEARCRANGDLDGPATSWFPNGTKRSEGNYRDGKMQGTWTFWYDTGALEARGLMYQGIRSCAWETWDKKGVLTPVTMADLPQGGCGRNADVHHWWGYFQFHELNIYQSTGAVLVLAPGLSWNPSFFLGNRWAIRGFVESSILRSSLAGFFPELSWGFLLSSEVIPGWAVEIGPGLQYWIVGGGDTNPMGVLNVGRKIQFWKLDRIFLGYNIYPINGLVHEFRLGLGIAL